MWISQTKTQLFDAYDLMGLARYFSVLLEVQDHFYDCVRGDKYNKSLLQAERPLSLTVHSKNIIS